MSFSHIFFRTIFSSITLIALVLGDFPGRIGRSVASDSYPLISRGKHYSRAKVCQVRGGDNSDDASKRPDRELVLGKDRELVHFSVDLKWVWGKLTDKLTYINFMRSSWRGIRDLLGVVDSGKEFKEIAIGILQHIRSINSESPLRLFQGDVKLAEWLSMTTGRFILVYIEEGNTKSPSISSVQYRYALSDSVLGKYINDEVRSSCRSTEVC